MHQPMEFSPRKWFWTKCTMLCINIVKRSALDICSPFFKLLSSHLFYRSNGGVNRSEESPRQFQRFVSNLDGSTSFTVQALAPKLQYGILPCSIFVVYCCFCSTACELRFDNKDLVGDDEIVLLGVHIHTYYCTVLFFFVIIMNIFRFDVT